MNHFLLKNPLLSNIKLIEIDKNELSAAIKNPSEAKLKTLSEPKFFSTQILLRKLFNKLKPEFKRVEKLDSSKMILKYHKQKEKKIVVHKSSNNKDLETKSKEWGPNDIHINVETNLKRAFLKKPLYHSIKANETKDPKKLI